MLPYTKRFKKCTFKDYFYEINVALNNRDCSTRWEMFMHGTHR